VNPTSIISVDRFWSAEQIDILTNLWPTHSAKVIGEKVGKTRNAVIGKARRMGLTGKKAQRDLVQCPRIRTEKKRSRPVRLPETIPEISPVEGGISIVDLNWYHCKAIIGSGDDGLARYCGAAVKQVVYNGEVLSKSFCPGHYHIFYIPPRSS